MHTRNFGHLDWQASALGFGCMRLPTTDGKPGSAQIDEAEATRMVRTAIDSGVNYLDTAYVYHGGQSEVFLGKALSDGYRDKVMVATKLPLWNVQAPEDFDRLLAEQLERLQTDHIDFYLFHALNLDRWRNVVLKHKLLDKAKQALIDGRIRHLGFSVHDNYACFAEIIDGSKLWNFCQIQYNYMDIENQAGIRGLKLAASRGLAVIVMEPLLGGRLAEPPRDVQAVMDAHPVRRTPVEWALEWLWAQPEVSLVLSGMSNMEQVQDNLRIADKARIDAFTEADQELIAQVRKIYQGRTAIPCTKCNYCMPCPSGVNIPANFDFFNYAHLYDNVPDARFRYGIFVPEIQQASACTECGSCESLCPQNIAISTLMPQVTALLA